MKDNLFYTNYPLWLHRLLTYYRKAYPADCKVRGSVRKHRIRQRIADAIHPPIHYKHKLPF